MNDDGSGRTAWQESLDSFDHGQLSIQGEKPESFNPYDRAPGERGKSERPVKRDLRKLSEWIKKMRELEDRKAKGDEE